ncbi:hypothetical protein BDZ89DRAFT_1226545 [Hymenopellis radicata]|nr:hypothetical protein BDZ89DRAFT_1226545 [Hymenopellis radicata]
MYLHRLALLLASFYTIQLAIAGDPCAVIAGKPFVPPAQALACQKYFEFNETLRQNLLTNVARVMELYTFEDYYLKSPSPFQDSTVNIREELARINATSYAVGSMPLRILAYHRRTSRSSSSRHWRNRRRDQIVHLAWQWKIDWCG